MIPPPWGLLTIGLLTLIPGDALCRLFFTPPRRDSPTAARLTLLLTIHRGRHAPLFYGCGRHAG